MGEVAAGTKVFSRTDRLHDLLESLERVSVEQVYVADDGKPSAEKAALFDREFGFDLTVIDLEYDAGLGKGRREIVDRLEEPYFLLVDTDHVVPPNVMALRSILEKDPSIGGVAGNLIEPVQGRTYQNAHDLSEDGMTLVRHTKASKPVEDVAGHPFVPFDFIPNAAMFKRDCVSEYTWDPEYTIGKEHLDFYVGHKKRTDWRFGVCPDVCFRHYPGGTDDYVSNRHSSDKNQRSEQYFRDKWGYDEIRSKRNYWFDTKAHSLPERAVEVYRDEGVWEVLRRGLRTVPDILRNS